MGGTDAAVIGTETTTHLNHHFGEDAHLLTGQESGIQSHRHGVRGAELSRAPGGGTALVNHTGSDKTGNTDLVSDTDAVEAHNNLQPSYICNKIIRYLR
jgi:hypothetical protein